MWNQVSAVLEEAHGILAELQSYNGAGQEIREVSTTPLGLHKQTETHMINSRGEYSGRGQGSLEKELEI